MSGGIFIWHLPEGSRIVIRNTTAELNDPIVDRDHNATAVLVFSNSTQLTSTLSTTAVDGVKLRCATVTRSVEYVVIQLAGKHQRIYY